MIFIAVRFTVRPERSDQWPTLVDDFTRATRAEPGNLFFDWSRDTENPHRYVLLEAFADAEAGAVHVASAHFKAGLEAMAGAIATTPEIIHVDIPDARGWNLMAELSPDPQNRPAGAAG
ncbi:putative quinol monooxygenase [Streptomyces sp. NPDC047928]|uniref:putative quinol monooxygenase n=1 Tax=unclassified Streptomyces TaxID=2593676 RepID=UPI00370FF267